VAQSWRVARSSSNRNPKPLDGAALERAALRYVERYATTRAKLRSYLVRKLRERGWAEEAPPPVEAIVERFAGAGYVDDKEFAVQRARSLGRRGYGARRVDEALRMAGIAEEDGAEARELTAEGAWEAALTFARRRRIGCFADEAADPDARRKALAAMMRAGHGFDIARRIVNAAPGDIPDLVK
jgi:regulatory protein